MKWLRWVGIVLVVLVVIAAAGAGYVVASTNARINQVYTVPQITALELPTDEESLTEGRRLYITRGCGDCHGENGAGSVVIDVPPVAVLIATNLTDGEGGIGAEFTTEDYMRAIRHGVDPSGKPYLLMPSHEFGHYSDADLSKMIAYIESLEPVDQSWPAQQVGPMGRMIMMDKNAGLIPAEIIDHANVQPQNDVVVAATADYGQYLTLGCTGCHGRSFTGGPSDDPSAPPAKNITFHETGLAGWSLEDFDKAVRSGLRPDGTVLDPFMPWAGLSLLTDTEVEAMYLYLRDEVEPKPYGDR